MDRLRWKHTSDFPFYDAKSNILNKSLNTGNTYIKVFKEFKDQVLETLAETSDSLKILQVERKVEMLIKRKNLAG